jgi:ATP-dependent protease ClpP protease subunit
MWALHQGKNDWYTIKNSAASGPTKVFIYDEIGYFGVGAGDFVHDLNEVDGALEVHINSPGGEVWDGITIYNTLRGRNDVTVSIDGLAASAASFIAMGASPGKLVIAETAEMMIHGAHSMAIGNAEDLRDLADRLDRASKKIAGIYATRTGKSVEYWLEAMKAETWYTGTEAVDAGLADGLVNHDHGQMGGDWDLSALRNAASVPYVGREQHRHPPMTGRHTHDHAAFGHDDADDGAHSHAHDHQNDADHDHGHDGHTGESGPNTDYNEAHMRVLCQLLDIDFAVMLNWDAAAAMKTAHSASDFRKICAGEHTSGEPDTAAHWALPHHTSPSSGPDKGGVVAALGRWNQTEGLKNKDAALAHLKAHARALGLPSGDSDHSGEGLWDVTDDEVLAIINAQKGA